MSEQLYLISKAERDLEVIFGKERRKSKGETHNLVGNLLAGPPGAAIGSAIGAPKGKKGRAAAGGGLGALGGAVAGGAAGGAIVRASKNKYARGAGFLLPTAGMYGGGWGGHKLAVQ